ncbi:MAG TPA: HepT-like ribonuclease domain-containing protein [Planctomycetota bacterium]|nr:HepT-like ribonuclease domain-containing protein [Planctomycetota bacterium]
MIEICSSRTLESFRADRVVRQATERNFEIMGEALRRLERLDPPTFRSIGDAHRVVQFRDVLAHGYDVVDPEVVWRIVQTDLPELLRRVDALTGTSS